MKVLAERVQEALRNNPEVEIVHVEERKYVPLPRGPWSHTFDIITAPREPVSSAAELQALLLRLVPDVTPTMRDDFREESRQLQLGKLYFTEAIGLEVRTRTLISSDRLLGAEEVTDHSTAGKLMRCTWVRLYPSRELARGWNGEYEFWVPTRLLSAPRRRWRRR